MPVNIFGPHGPGVGETTDRPAQAASTNPLRTWFRDCVAGVAGSGTKITSTWLNFMTANMRRAIDGRNVQPQDELDDDLLLKAINSVDRQIVNQGSAGHVLYLGYDVDGRHILSKVQQGAGIAINRDPSGHLIITNSAPHIPPQIIHDVAGFTPSTFGQPLGTHADTNMDFLIYCGNGSNDTAIWREGDSLGSNYGVWADHGSANGPWASRITVRGNKIYFPGGQVTSTNSTGRIFVANQTFGGTWVRIL